MGGRVCELPTSVREYVREIMRSGEQQFGHDFPARACFGNAQIAALVDDTLAQRLAYFEGAARGLSGVWVHHAWVAVDSDAIVELTWRPWDALEAPLVQPRLDFEYVGVRVSLSRIRDAARERGSLFSLLPRLEVARLLSCVSLDGHELLVPDALERLAQFAD